MRGNLRAADISGGYSCSALHRHTLKSIMHDDKQIIGMTA
jgi:hypothetical protein